MEELELAISHRAWKHEQFAAVRGVGVCRMWGIGRAGVFGAGQAVGIMFCLVSWPVTEREQLPVPVPALAPWAQVAEVPGCPLGLSGLSLWLCPVRAIPQGLSRDLWAWCQHLTKRKPPLFPALVLTSLTALYREASVCPGTGTNAAHGRPATLLVLFLLSLLRQGCIKRVFAVLKPRITPHLLKVFRTATLLAPAPLLELVQSDPVPAVPVPAAAPAQTEPLFALLGVCRGGCSPSRARTS